MLSHASSPNIPASVNCFYEYLSTQKKIFSLTRMILEILQFIILKCFGQPWAYSTTRNWNAWINLLYIQLHSKTFIPQLILEILLTHHLKELWTCPDMPHHTQSKCLDQFVASVDVQPHTHTYTHIHTHTHTHTHTHKSNSWLKFFLCQVCANCNRCLTIFQHFLPPKLCNSCPLESFR